MVYNKKRNIRLEEGSICKGGLGCTPSGQRPQPPKAQNTSKPDTLFQWLYDWIQTWKVPWEGHE